MIRFLITTTLFFIVVFALPLVSQENASLQKLIDDGDQFANVTFDNAKALEKFLEAEKVAPSDYDVLWRISRTFVDIGEHFPSGTKEEKAKQLDEYQKSLDYANKAIAVKGDGAMGYTRRAIANGRVALFKGVWESIDLVKSVRDDCQKAIGLDPKEPAAHYVLGRTHAKLCEKSKIIRWPLGLSWANREEAKTCYDRAIELRPTFIMYHLDAAKNLIEMDEFTAAREHLTTIGGLPKQDEDDDQFRAEAKQLLEKIKDE
jgi:tetratricopeptide (TPR) repeat protein